MEQEMGLIKTETKENAAFFVSREYPKLMQIGDNTVNNPYWQGYHLHLTSDNIIYEDNFFLTNGASEVHKAELSLNIKGKVIRATTDESLKLPLISKKLVRQYVDTAGKLDSAMVEMFESPDWNKVLNNQPYKGDEIKRVKVNENNYVSAYLTDNSWDNIFKEYEEYYRKAVNLKETYFPFAGWIKENYRPPIRYKK